MTKIQKVLSQLRQHLFEADDDAVEIEPEEMSGRELLSKWEDKKNINRYEGNSGVRNLEDLIRVLNLDYRSIVTFLEDNSGAIGAIRDWIEEWIDQVPEWKESLQAEIEESLDGKMAKPAPNVHHQNLLSKGYEYKGAEPHHMADGGAVHSYGHKNGNSVRVQVLKGGDVYFNASDGQGRRLKKLEV